MKSEKSPESKQTVSAKGAAEERTDTSPTQSAATVRSATDTGGSNSLTPKPLLPASSVQSIYCMSDLGKEECSLATQKNDAEKLSKKKSVSAGSKGKAKKGSKKKASKRSG